MVGAVHLGQPRGRRALGDLAEQAARADRRQLRLIAGEDELRVRLARQLDHLREPARVRHPRLVEHDNRPRVELKPLLADAVGERVGGHRLPDPRLGPEPLRGGTGDRGADHAVAVALPRLARRAEHDTLTGPGLTDQHGHATRTRHQLERLLLLVAERSAHSLAGALGCLGASERRHDRGRSRRSAR